MTGSRRGVSALLLAALAGPLLLGGTSRAAAAAQSADAGIRLEISGLSPVVEPKSGLRIRGRIINLSVDDLRDVQLRIHVDSRVSTRSELQRRAADDDGPPQGSSTTADALHPDDLDDIGPQASLDVDVTFPAAELRGLAEQASVHPLRIEVRGRVNRARRTSLGHVDTFLQWWPGRTAASRLAWVWPLTEPVDQGAKGIFDNDELAASIASDGRLGELLSVASELSDRIPFTWAVDPALVSQVAQMADGYSVRDGDDVRDGEGVAVATAWLAQLDRSLASTNTAVLGFPYADPDVAALVRARGVGLISEAFTSGREVLTERGARLAPTLAWPPGGALTRDGLEVLTANGARTVVLAEDSVASESVGSFTPSAQLRLGAQAADGTGLVADAALAEILRDGPRATGERLAVQRFLAETAMITLERPNTSRDIVVTPPRDWAPRRAYAASLLRLSGDVPWLEAATLPAISTREPDDVSRFVDYSESAESDELPQSHLQSIIRERDRVARYRSILPPDQSALPAALDEVLLRATSAGWRGSTNHGARLVSSVHDVLTQEFTKVRLSTGGLITLASDTGRIPITIVNEFPHPVLVKVRVESRNRLILDEPDRPAELVPPGRRQIDIEGRAAQAGEFTVDLALLTPDGRELPGATAQLRVRSTAYGRVALVVVIGAFAVLVAASVARLVRRRRRPAAEAPAPEAAPVG